MTLPVFALGRNERAFIVPETTYGTAASVPASGNAIKFKSLTLAEKENRVVRDDKRNTRSPLATIVRRQDVSWSINGYLLPSGAAGTAPDGWDDIFKAGFGTQTINSSTSVVYTLAKEFESALTIHRAIGNSASEACFSEMAVGCVVDKISFSLTGSDEALVTASGFGATVIRAGASVVSTDSGTVVVVTPSGDSNKFDPGAYIDIGSVTGKLISSIVYGTDSITVPSHSASSPGDLVVPSACTVSETFVSTATPISGILGSATIAGVSTEIVSAQIDLVNNAKAHNTSFGFNKTTSFHRSNRMVTGSFDIRLTAANFSILAKTRNATNVALVFVAGTAAGSIATFSLPFCNLDYTAVPSTPLEEVIVKIPFVAYGSSGEDELSVTLT